MSGKYSIAPGGNQKLDEDWNAPRDAGRDRNALLLLSNLGLRACDPISRGAANDGFPLIERLSERVLVFLSISVPETFKGRGISRSGTTVHADVVGPSAYPGAADITLFVRHCIMNPWSAQQGRIVGIQLEKRLPDCCCCQAVGPADQ
ncbi:hypothetical protein Q1695_006287 [Nippostrongylus brasiliensis]|nr:hypothetical protein Q1695_006287 [Nippostrongylus brasiliensis]